VLNHDGNLFDASMLAAMAALLSARLPVAVKTEDGYRVDRSRFTRVVPVNRRVVTVTLAKIAGKLVVDPTYEEEQVADTRMVVAVSDDGRIAGIQKTGMGDLEYREVLSAVAIAVNKASIYHKALEDMVLPYRAKIEEELRTEKAEEAAEGAAELQPAPHREHEEPVEIAEVVDEEGQSGGEGSGE